MSIPTDALVMDTLDSDILVGVPLCKFNSIETDLRQEIISLQDTNIPYSGKPQDHHDIYFTESFVLCNDSSINKLNDLILINMTPENTTQHSRIELQSHTKKAQQPPK